MIFSQDTRNKQLSAKQGLMISFVKDWKLSEIWMKDQTKFKLYFKWFWTFFREPRTDEKKKKIGVARSICRGVLENALSGLYLHIRTCGNDTVCRFHPTKPAITIDLPTAVQYPLPAVCLLSVCNQTLILHGVNAVDHLYTIKRYKFRKWG